MLKLCGFHLSNYHNKVRLALLEKGIPYEDTDAKPSQEEAYLAKSPMGKVPYAEIDGKRLCESQVIVEYLEDKFPQKPLLPKDPLERAKVRELITMLELHMELVARRLYREVFFGGPKMSDEAREAVRKELAKGIRAFKALAKFEPFLAGKELTLADCAAAVHLPLVSSATKLAFGKDALEDIPQVKGYLKMLGERPAFAKVSADNRAARQALAAQAKK